MKPVFTGSGIAIALLWGCTACGSAEPAAAAATDASAVDAQVDADAAATTDTVAAADTVVSASALVAQLDKPSAFLTAADEPLAFGDMGLQEKVALLTPVGTGKGTAAEGILDDPALNLPGVQAILGDKAVAVHLRITLTAKDQGKGAAFAGSVETSAGALIGHRALGVESGDQLELNRKPGPEALATLAFQGQLAAGGEEPDRDSFVVVLLHAAKATPVLTVRLGSSVATLAVDGQAGIGRVETGEVTAMVLAQRRPEGPCTTARGLLFGQATKDNPAVSQLSGLVWQGGKATGFVKGILGKASDGTTRILLKGIDLQGKAAWHGRYDGPLSARIGGKLTKVDGAALGTFAMRLGLGGDHDVGPQGGRYALVLSTECEGNGGKP